MRRNRRFVPAALVALAALVAALLTPSSVSAHHPSPNHCAAPERHLGEWRQFSVDLEGTRNQARESLIDHANVRFLQPHWTFNANRESIDSDDRFATNSEITGYPVAADGCVYIGTSTGSQKPGWIFALNAETGKVVWRTQMSHGIYSTLSVHDGKVFAFVSRVGGEKIGDKNGPSPWGPYVVALDQHTGERLWWGTADWQVGADAVSSPIYIPAGPPFGDRAVVWVGVSGTAAEGDEGERLGYQGVQAFFDADTGELLKRTYSIPTEEERDDGYAGGAVWSTLAVDSETGFGYVGTGNPFNYDEEHEHTNAVLKMDLRQVVPGPEGGSAPNPDFGEIAGSYKGEYEQYNEEVAEAVDEVCEEVEELNMFGAGFECANMDLDFGATPNIFRDATGRKLVGAGQKSGVYHVFDPDTMEREWASIVGVPSPVGGIVGTTAVDEYGVHGPHTVGGYIWSVERGSGSGDGGRLRWLQPLTDAVHWGNPVTAANGLVYTVDLNGFLSVFDSQTGIPMLRLPLNNNETWTDPTFTWGGVSVARGTVFASVGVGLTSVGEWPPWPEMPNGFVIAFKPGLPIDLF